MLFETGDNSESNQGSFRSSIIFDGELTVPLGFAFDTDKYGTILVARYPAGHVLPLCDGALDVAREDGELVLNFTRHAFSIPLRRCCRPVPLRIDAARWRTTCPAAWRGPLRMCADIYRVGFSDSVARLHELLTGLEKAAREARVVDGQRWKVVGR